MQDGERMDDQLRSWSPSAKSTSSAGDYSLAAGHLEHAVARGVGFADVHPHAGSDLFHQRASSRRAQRALQKALEINPGYIEAGLNWPSSATTSDSNERASRSTGALERARGRGQREPNGRRADGHLPRGKIATCMPPSPTAYFSMRRP